MVSLAPGSANSSPSSDSMLILDFTCSCTLTWLSSPLWSSLRTTIALPAEEWPLLHLMSSLLCHSLCHSSWSVSSARDLRWWRSSRPRHLSILWFSKSINRADGDWLCQVTSSSEDSWPLFYFRCQSIILSSSFSMCLFWCRRMLTCSTWLLSSHTSQHCWTTMYFLMRLSIRPSLLPSSSFRMPRLSCRLK